MKEIRIHTRIIDNKIATVIHHFGFGDGEYTVEQILTTIGILDNLKQQQRDKLKNLSAKDYNDKEV